MDHGSLLHSRTVSRRLNGILYQFGAGQSETQTRRASILPREVAIEQIRHVHCTPPETVGSNHCYCEHRYLQHNRPSFEFSKPRRLMQWSLACPGH